MKGLIVKEFLFTREYLFFCLAILLAFVIMMNLSGMPVAAGFSIGLCAMFGGMMSLVSFTYDCNAHWESYALTLPRTKRQIVLSKYLFGFILMSAGAALGLACTALFSFAGFIEPASEDAKTALGIICTTLIAIAAQLPFVYRFGIEKSRIFVTALGVFLFMALAKYFLEMPKDGTGTLLVILPFAAACALPFSFFLSCRMFERGKMERKPLRTKQIRSLS